MSVVFLGVVGLLAGAIFSGAALLTVAGDPAEDGLQR